MKLRVSCAKRRYKDKVYITCVWQEQFATFQGLIFAASLISGIL